MSNRTRERQRGRRKRDLERTPRRPGESRLSHRLRAQLRSAFLRVGKEGRPTLNAALGRSSKIGSAPYFAAADFPWLERLESQTESIRKEAEFLLQARSSLAPLHEISLDHSRIDTDDRWKVYFLKGYGFWMDEQCRRCPNTFAAVKQIPGVESAFFSILEAGKHIPRHRGPTRAIFTCHLPLLVPHQREHCWIEVDGIRHSWESGKAVLFDDTYKHEVRNDTDEDRVVLLLHIRRPLYFPASLLGGLVFAAIRWSPFVQDGLNNQRRWEQRIARDG